jgi:hypothetical protein
MGGPVKSLKTSILVDLALSKASGTPFLGRYPVPKAGPVMMLIGENSALHIGRLATRIAAAKGISRPDQAPVKWMFEVGPLDDAANLKKLTSLLWLWRIELLIVDPTYLFFPSVGVQAANVFSMGEQLLKFSRACLDSGVTPLLAHHTPKDKLPGTPTELQELAFAGFSEFARQWILVNRQVAYDPARPGEHRLIFSYGGAAGHSGQLGLAISEGELQADFSGRKWEVQLSDVPAGRKGSRKRATQRDGTNKEAVEKAVLPALRGLGASRSRARRFSPGPA